MVRKKFNWKFPFILYLVFLNVFIKSLPLTRKSENINVIAPTDSIIIDDKGFSSVNDVATQALLQDITSAALLEPSILPLDSTEVASENTAEAQVLQANTTNVNLTTINSSILRSGDLIRPGQIVTLYNVEITPNGNTFNGRVIIRVDIPDATMREDPVKFHVEGLNIQSVKFGLLSLANPSNADFNVRVDDGILEVSPNTVSASYIFLIEYTGNIRKDGIGLYRGDFGDSSYLAMNLNPTNARRVFPCMDEVTTVATVSFTLINVGYSNVVGNTVTEITDSGSIDFTPIATPPHRWGIVMHDFSNINNPVVGETRLWLQQGVTGQEAQASIIINALFNRMETWASRSYSEIHVGQNEVIDVIAMPDITKEWIALGTVCIWEPYILMNVAHATSQRKTAMIEIGKGLAQQWFGFVIFPENWRYQWINTGLSTFVAYEMARAFQEDAQENDPTVIDINAVFVAEIIQESLLRDSYNNVLPLEANVDLLKEEVIRENVNGLAKLKAPAIMWMLKQVLGYLPSNRDVDYIQSGARALLNERPHSAFTSSIFYDAINDALRTEPSGLIGNLEEDFMQAWVTLSNYPLVNVQLWSGGVTLTQERFAFSNVEQEIYPIPLTYTTSQNPNFDNIAPQMILKNNQLLNLFLTDDDWFIANIQGQGYYRVHYDTALLERIIKTLDDPQKRDQIHSLNRATLIDDALNLARSGRLTYDLAFRVVLTMEHETEYAPWKAFVRNMDFLRKRLEVGDDDRDPDIYVRMIRRSIPAFENQIGFKPDPLIIEDAMRSITRGVVMEHVCKARYQPCVAAAMDWFYDPNSDEPAVNPNIPHDIRPAVYCTMIREGDETSRQALLNRYREELSAYERLVIVRGLACSTDEGFLTKTLEDTSRGDMFGVEERVEFFKALLESNRDGADLALKFIRQNTNVIRENYGGADRLEDILFVISENMMDADLTNNFGNSWVNSIFSDLADSTEVAKKAVAHAQQNLVWDDNYKKEVYQWIEENDAHTIAVSIALMIVCFIINVLTQ